MSGHRSNGCSGLQQARILFLLFETATKTLFVSSQVERHPPFPRDKAQGARFAVKEPKRTKTFQPTHRMSPDLPHLLRRKTTRPHVTHRWADS